MSKIQLSKFVLILSCLLFSFVALAQTKAKIHIKKEINGQKVEETKEIDLANGQDLSQILKELGVVDELGQLLPGQEFQINIEKSNQEGDNSSFDLNYFPEMNFPFAQGWDMHEMEPQAYLGVMLIGGNGTSNVVEISEIIEGTAAEKAELEIGDQILKIDEREIASIEDVINYIHQKNPGDEVKLTYSRDGKKKNKKVILGEREVGPIMFNPNMENGEMPAFPVPNFDYFFDGDSITIICPDKNLCDSMKICQPFTWEGEGFLNEETPFLGVTPGGLCYQTGVLIGSILPGSTAEEIGLLENDIIQEINGVTISDFDQMKETICKQKVGEEIKVTVLRDGKKKTFDGKLGSKASSTKDDFRIFHDYQGMDEFGNYNYNFEFDMDENDIEQNMEELLRQLEENQQFILSEKDRLQEQLNELRDGNTENISTTIDIIEISAEEASAVNTNASPKLSIDNTLKFETISFFTNPNSGVVNLSFTLSEFSEFTVVVFDAFGHQVFYEMNTGFNEYDSSIDLSAYPAGSYFLQISQNKKYFSRKIAKG